MRLELLEPSFRGQCATAEAGKFFGQVANQNVKFANGSALHSDQMVPAKVIWRSYPGLKVPADAVSLQSGQKFVFVAANTEKGTVAKQVPVELGEIEGNAYIAKSGLKPGDQLIVGGLQKSGDGAPVQPMPQGAAAKPAGAAAAKQGEH